MEMFWIGLVIITGLFAYMGFVEILLTKYYNSKHTTKIIGKDVHSRKELLKNQSVSVKEEH